MLGRLNIILIYGFPDSSAGKESACNTGDLGSIPGLGRSPREENNYPLQKGSQGHDCDFTFTLLTASNFKGNTENMEWHSAVAKSRYTQELLSLLII